MDRQRGPFARLVEVLYILTFSIIAIGTGYAVYSSQFPKEVLSQDKSYIQCTSGPNTGHGNFISEVGIYIVGAISPYDESEARKFCQYGTTNYYAIDDPGNNNFEFHPVYETVGSWGGCIEYSFLAFMGLFILNAVITTAFRYVVDGTVNHQ